jgi:Skp family chaperone for outer membrane proteins
MTKTLIPALVLCLGAAAAVAQEAAAPRPEARAPRIAVIDMAKVSAESIMGKSYSAQLETLKNEIDAEGTKKQAELQKLDAAIKALQDELEKQGGVLSPEAADKKRQDVVRKSRERQAFLEDGQQDLQRMRESAQQKAQALNGEFQNRIKPHIESVAKEKGVDILLDSQVALTVNKAFDISQDVIVRADDAERAAKGKPAAAAPAPKASPTPTPKP